MPPPRYRRVVVRPNRNAPSAPLVYDGAVAPRQAQGTGVTRRDLARWALGGTLIVAGASTLRRVFMPARLDERGRRTLEALLDAILPDGERPGHRATGVLPRLVAELENERQTRRALVEGMRLLERRGRAEGASSFAALGPERRVALFTACGEDEYGSLPRFFYQNVRDAALRLHYSRRAAWRPLGLPHPPQPDGYEDFAEAPRG
jgi:hypothetical protein